MAPPAGVEPTTYRLGGVAAIERNDLIGLVKEDISVQYSVSSNASQMPVFIELSSEYWTRF
jgi:hypothetical protein